MPVKNARSSAGLKSGPVGRIPAKGFLKTLFGIVCAAVFSVLLSGWSTTSADSAPVPEPGPVSEQNSVPVAAYFFAGAVEAYKQISEDYQEQGVLFPDFAKEVLDIVYFSFAEPSADGSVIIPDCSGLEECLELQKDGVRVVLCLSGVTRSTCSALTTITSSDSLTDKFVSSVMDCVEQYGFDGIDLDWEAVSSQCRPSASSVNLLLRAFRSEMDRRGAGRKTPYFLSIAVPASSWGLSGERFDFPTINTLVDTVNIMSYDLNREDLTTHLSPLYSSSLDQGYGFGADYAVSLLTSLGMDESKLTIGAAGYGKAYRLERKEESSSSCPGLGTAASLCSVGLAGSFDSGTVYGGTISYVRKSGTFRMYTETTPDGGMVGSYLYDAEQGLFITYDSPEAIAAKYRYAQAHPGMGIMYWAYTEDSDGHVLKALRDACADSSGSAKTDNPPESSGDKGPVPDAERNDASDASRDSGDSAVPEPSSGTTGKETGAPGVSQTDSRRHRVILDTDTAVDDALAIILAAKAPNVTLEGVTVLAGNVDLEQGARNALMSLQVAGSSDVPVFMGSDTRYSGEPIESYSVFGADGMGDRDLIHPEKTVQEQDAIDFILETVKANPGEIEILATGPLTNIAKAISRDRETMSKVKRIWSMGTGGLETRGNASPVAEFNVYLDPEAYKVVVDSGIPMTIIGLDICTREELVFTEERLNAMRSFGSCGEFIADAAQFFLDSNTAEGIDCVVFPDYVAAVSMIFDEFITDSKTCHAEVITGDTPAAGLVIFYPEGGSYGSCGEIHYDTCNCVVVSKVDAQSIIDTIRSVIRNPS